MSEYILGLDLGPNSIGWALVAAEANDDGEVCPKGLLDTSKAGHPPLGVRVFEAGLQNFDQGSKEASRNQKRRQARSMRKTLARRRARKALALEVLQREHLLPTDADELRQVMGMDPYQLRAEGLDRALEPYELGRALYHLSQRRGFKSNRLSGDPKEEKGLLKEISQLETAIDAAGSRTLGEYLHAQKANPSGTLPPRLRARQARMDLYEDAAPRRTRRSMYEQELEALIEAQSNHTGRSPMSPEGLERLRHALFFQHDFAVSQERRDRAPSRANLHRAPGVRPCPYEPGEVGCPRSDWLAQRFRILKEVQSLRLSEEHRPERSLTPEESRHALEFLSGQRETSFDSLRKELGKKFGLREPVEFNLARGGRAKIKGNEIDAVLANSFGKKLWRGMENEEREQLRSLLVDIDSEEELKTRLEQEGLTDSGKQDKLCAFRPKDDGYLSFSKKALERIVPLMEEGLLEHEAIEQSYPETFEADGLALLPSLVAMQLDARVRPKIPPQIQNELTNLTNPVVRRALVEVRKVINALVREHGKPARIVVEMAREMRQGKQARKEYSFRTQRRAKLREEARSELKELLGGRWPKRGDVDRWVLWQQQKHSCPYCGKGISASALVSADTEIDHILPRWQSLDDSQNNKVLCCANCNAEKANRTPMAWLGAGSDRLAAVLKRVRQCVESKSHPAGMPFGKIKRFEQEAVDAEDFASSQLNDTRYISRLVASYLLLLYPTHEHVGQRRVLSSRGSLTAHLRRMWGLNDVLTPLVGAHGEILPGSVIEHEGWTEKTRVDHRHHAVDALVVALSSRAFTKRLQDAWRRQDEPRGQASAFPEPWEGLRAHAQDALESICVSHRPMRRRRGELHEATYYGAAKEAADGYVTRKRLEELKGKSVRQIRDRAVRKAVEARLVAAGWDGKSNDLPKGWHTEELFLPTSKPRPGRKERKAHPIRRVRVVVTLGRALRLGDRGHRFAAPGSNHCLEVYDSSEAPHTRFRIRSRFAANQRESRGVSVPRLSLVGVLHRKDTVRVVLPGLSQPRIAVVQNISGPEQPGTQGLDLSLRDVRDSRPDALARRSPLARVKSQGKWNELQLQLLDVDPLGRIGPGKQLSAEVP